MNPVPDMYFLQSIEYVRLSFLQNDYQRQVDSLQGLRRIFGANKVGLLHFPIQLHHIHASLVRFMVRSLGNQDFLLFIDQVGPTLTNTSQLVDRYLQWIPAIVQGILPFTPEMSAFTKSFESELSLMGNINMDPRRYGDYLAAARRKVCELAVWIIDTWHSAVWMQSPICDLDGHLIDNAKIRAQVIEAFVTSFAEVRACLDRDQVAAITRRRWYIDALPAQGLEEQRGRCNNKSIADDSGGSQGLSSASDEC